MKGKWPESYLSNPNPDKKIEEIWQDLDNYSFEELYSTPKMLHQMRVVVPLPPLLYKNHFVKGFCYTQTPDLIIDKLPDVQKLFHVCANSMTFSYPWSQKADCYFTCYENKKRERYFKKKNPHLKNISYLPLQDADYTNERVMKPVCDLPKVIDVLCLATPFPVKNLPVFAKALKIYEQKYGYRLKVIWGLGETTITKRPDGSIDYSQTIDYAKKPLQEVDEILDNNIKAYIDFIPYINYWQLPKYFSLSKCAVLCSLYEGKNRFIHEAMSSNVPVVVFKDFNKFTRAKTPVFFGNGGEYAKSFTPEALADAIHKILINPQAYAPRENYLKYSGRANFMKNVIASMPYYQNNIPDLKEGNLFINKWVNQAMQAKYNMNYENFLYEGNPAISHVVGVENTFKLFKYYYQKFYLPWKNISLDDLQKEDKIKFK